MVYTLVLEASAERIESSSLSLPTKQSGDWRNWERASFASLSQEFESPIFHQRKIMKTRKPRNHVQLALMKRGGSGSHKKTHKQLRGKWKRTTDV